MSGRRASVLAIASIAALLVAAPPASAETFNVEAKDGESACPGQPFGCFDPDIVDASVGDSVVWGFTQTSLTHDVQIVPYEGDPRPKSPYFSAGSTDTYTQQFDEQRAYAYYCTLHGSLTDDGIPSGMGGWVLVDTELPDPGPDPLPNPTGPPPWLEDPDDTPPKITKLKAGGTKKGVNLAFKLSEAARVTATFKRDGRTVKRANLGELEEGTANEYVGHLRRGRYKVQLRAKDDAGNVSKAARTSARVG